MDTFLDYSIVGMVKIEHGIENYDTWCIEMLEEFGEEIRFFLPGIFAQAQEMVEMTLEDLEINIEKMEPIRKKRFQTVLKSRLPYFWPSKKNQWNFFQDIISQNLIHKAMFIITDITFEVAEWLLEKFPKENNPYWAFIICINPNGIIKRNTLDLLYDFQALHPNQFDVKLLIPNMLNGSKLNINLSFWNDDSGANKLYIGTAPSLGLGKFQKGYFNSLLEPDLISTVKISNLIQEYWDISLPLTKERCNIPTFIPLEANKDAIVAWSSYCDFFIPDEDRESTLETDSPQEENQNYTSDNENTTNILKKLDIKEPTDLEKSLLDLSDKGHGIRLSYNSSPLEVTLSSKLLGLSEKDQIGSIKRTVSYKVKLFDDETQPILENSRKGVRELLNVLSYSYADGQWWIPSKADKLLKEIMDEYKKSSLELLSKENSAGVQEFLLKRKPDLYNSCQRYYKQQYPDREFTDRQMNSVLQYLFEKIKEIFDKGVLPTLNPYSLQLVYNSTSEHEDSWANVSIFLEDVVTRPRKLLNGNIDLLLFKHGIDVDEYIEAMNILDDTIWKTYRLGHYNIINIAKQELNKIKEITTSKLTSIEKSVKYLELIQGKNLE
jgi:hypothetical protein